MGVAVIGSIFFTGLESDGGYSAALSGSVFIVVVALIASAALCLTFAPRSRDA